MIIRVLENLRLPDARYILIARKEHIEAENKLVNEIQSTFNAIIIPIEKMTEGTACTVLYARQYINNDDPLLIANSDQIVDFEIELFINDCQLRRLDGSILTFSDKERNPKWSFVKIDNNKIVTEVQEKKPISEFATVGIYFFAQGLNFVNSAIDMFIARDTVNGEYYTCPTYNYAIREGKKIGIFNINFSDMHGIGTPADLNLYLKSLAPN